MKATNSEANRAMVKARISMLMKDLAFFGTLALKLRLVETYVLPDGRANLTAATDGISLYYNPDYVLGLSPEQRIGLVAHARGRGQRGIEQPDRQQHGSDAAERSGGDFLLVPVHRILPAARSQL